MDESMRFPAGKFDEHDAGQLAVALFLLQSWTRITSDGATGGGSFTLNFCDNNAFYETVGHKLKEELRDLQCGISVEEFESPEEWQRAIDQNTLVELHWHPNSPGGFRSFYAPDLSALARFILKTHKEEQWERQADGWVS